MRLIRGRSADETRRAGAGWSAVPLVGGPVIDVLVVDDLVVVAVCHVPLGVVGHVALMPSFLMASASIACIFVAGTRVRAPVYAVTFTKTIAFHAIGPCVIPTPLLPVHCIVTTSDLLTWSCS